MTDSRQILHMGNKVCFWFHLLKHEAKHSVQLQHEVLHFSEFHYYLVDVCYFNNSVQDNPAFGNKGTEPLKARKPLYYETKRCRNAKKPQFEKLTFVL